MRWVWLVLVFSVGAGCRGGANSSLSVVDPSGQSKSVPVGSLSREGARAERGFVPLAQLGQGSRVHVEGAGGQSLDLSAQEFGGQYRLFASKRDRLMLVKFTGPGVPPPPGAKSGGESSGKHRDRWETVIEKVASVRFEN